VEGRTSTNGTNCMDEINYGAINPNGKNQVSNSLWSFSQYFHIHSTYKKWFSYATNFTLEIIPITMRCQIMDHILHSIHMPIL
jgi:hypothetical protein